MSDQDKHDLAKAARGGLCATCTYAKLVRSSKSSIFVLCTHPSLPKYQGQPVLKCFGFEVDSSQNTTETKALENHPKK
jgi:hypothetical protein